MVLAFYSPFESFFISHNFVLFLVTLLVVMSYSTSYVNNLVENRTLIFGKFGK